MSYLIKSIILLNLIFGLYCLEIKTKINRNIKRFRSRQLRFLMEKHSVVPDVVDAVPSNIIKILYKSGVTVNLGNELTPTQVKDKPKVEWPVDAGALYTLCMTDPDIPVKPDPKFPEFKHWLIINIPGFDVNSGQTLADYISSGPPKGTGLHRYVFLVYKQLKRIETTEKSVNNRSVEGRRPFSIRDFAKRHSLGEPIAANFYKAQFDDYVPVLQSQLKG